MPFKQHSPVIYRWERLFAQGQEFYETVSAKVARDNWTRLLRAVAGGALEIQYHHRPIGIVVSPRILRDLAFKWRGLNAKPHTVVEKKLTGFCDSATSSATGEFHPVTLTVRHQPPSVITLLRDLEPQSGAVLITRRNAPCAILIPLTVLVRLQRELADHSMWGNQVAEWIRAAAEDSAG